MVAKGRLIDAALLFRMTVEMVESGEANRSRFRKSAIAPATWFLSSSSAICGVAKPRADHIPRSRIIWISILRRAASLSASMYAVST